MIPKGWMERGVAVTLMLSLIVLVGFVGVIRAMTQIDFTTTNLSSTGEPNAPDVAVGASSLWAAGTWVGMPPLSPLGDATVGDLWNGSTMPFEAEPAYDTALDVSEAGIAHVAYLVKLSGSDYEIRYGTCDLSSDECTPSAAICDTNVRVNSLDLTLDGTGSPHVVWSTRREGSSGGHVYYTSYTGTSWEPPEMLDSPSMVSQDVAITYGNDSVHVVWAESSPETKVWYGYPSSPEWIREPIGEEGERGQPGNPDVAAGSGRVFVVWDWCASSSSCDQCYLVYARSNENGYLGSWDPPREVGTGRTSTAVSHPYDSGSLDVFPSLQPAVAMTEEGWPAVAWHADAGGGDYAVYYNYATDGKSLSVDWAAEAPPFHTLDWNNAASPALEIGGTVPGGDPFFHMVYVKRVGNRWDVTYARNGERPSQSSVHFSSGSYSVGEEDGTATITVTLDTVASCTATVNYETSDGTATAGEDKDYVAESGELTFAPGETEKTFTVDIVSDEHDELYEADETVFLTLSDAEGALLGVPDGAVLIIEDDDEPPIVSFEEDTYTVGEDAGCATLTVTLSAVSGLTATVEYGTSDGTATAEKDYVATNGELTFAPGDTEEIFTVDIVSDELDEDDETVMLTLAGAGGASIGGTNPALLTIEDDDDVPGVAFDQASYQVGENAGQAVVTVTLSAASGVTATVDYETSDGTATAGEDYVATTGELTFAPGDTEKTFAVDVTSDELYEADETVGLVLSNAEGAVLGEPDAAVLTIEDDDDVPGVAFDQASYQVGENAGQAVVTVTLSAVSGLTATVDYETSDGTATAGEDYVVTTGELTFAPGDTEETFAVDVTSDELLESDETVVLTLSGPEKATITETNPALLTIVDDDQVDHFVYLSFVVRE